MITEKSMDGKWKTIYEEVKQKRPLREKLLEYTFLKTDRIYIERNDRQEVMVVAEDKWSATYGMSLVITEDGRLWVAEMPDFAICNYCANSFGQFVAMAEQYWEIVGSASEEETFEKCEEPESILREAIRNIDPTALENENYFWSTLAEEIGYGIV